MQSPRWTWLTLIACAAAGSAAAQQDPGPADAGQAVEAPAEEAEPGRQWMLPPVTWFGSLAYDLRGTRGEDEGTTTAHLLTGSLGLRTYIYAPWLATVSGNLSLTTSTTETELEGSGGSLVGPSLHEQIRSRQQFATGYARMDVFPQSRFPFEAHYEKTDSRIDSGLASTFDFQTMNIGFSQRYRPPAGQWDLMAGYDRREQTARLFKATQDEVNGDFNTRWKHNQLNLNGTVSEARSTAIEDESRYSTLVGRHNYAPSAALSVDTTANWTRTEEDSPFRTSDLQVMQWSSVGLYRRENSPLQLTGTARALHLREDLTGTGVDAWGGTLGANYDFNKNLRLAANAGFSATSSNGNDTSGVALSLGATYTGDSIQIGQGRYDWFTGGTVGFTTTEGDRIESEQQTGLNLQLGHSYNRIWQTGQMSSLTLTASQSINYFNTQSNLDRPGILAFDEATVLLNSLSGTWQVGGEGRTAYARATYSDSMALQGPDNRFQLLNFQLSGNFEFDSRRTLTGDLTYQQTEQEDAFRADGLTLLPGTRQTSRGASGEIVYRHRRLWGVPQLRFESRLKLAQDVQKQPGTLLSLPDRETKLWENRLDWTVGRIETTAILRLSEVDGRRQEAFMFRILRYFGN